MVFGPLLTASVPISFILPTSLMGSDKFKVSHLSQSLFLDTGITLNFYFSQKELSESRIHPFPHLSYLIPPPHTRLQSLYSRDAAMRSSNFRTSLSCTLKPCPSGGKATYISLSSPSFHSRTLLWYAPMSGVYEGFLVSYTYEWSLWWPRQNVLQSCKSIYALCSMAFQVFPSKCDFPGLETLLRG